MTLHAFLFFKYLGFDYDICYISSVQIQIWPWSLTLWPHMTYYTFGNYIWNQDYPYTVSLTLMFHGTNFPSSPAFATLNLFTSRERTRLHTTHAHTYTRLRIHLLDKLAYFECPQQIWFDLLTSKNVFDISFKINLKLRSLVCKFSRKRPRI